MKTITSKPRTNSALSSIFRDGPPAVIGVTKVPKGTPVLHFVPDSRDIERALDYPGVQAISLNNITFDAKTKKALARVGPELSKLRYLSIWNCRRFESSLLSATPRVEYLQITHASAQLEDWTGLEALEKLAGLFLMDAHKCVDLGLLSNLSGALIALSVIGTKQLERLTGVESQAGTLTHLALRSSIHDPPKKRTLPLSLAGLGSLRELRKLELLGYTYAAEELAKAIAKMPHVKVDADA